MVTQVTKINTHGTCVNHHGACACMAVIRSPTDMTHERNCARPAEAICYDLAQMRSIQRRQLLHRLPHTMYTKRSSQRST